MTDEREAYLRSVEEEVRSYYDVLAPEYDTWLRKFHYYYSYKVHVLRRLLPQPGRALEIGCGIGQNLASLDLDHGTGIDLSERVIEEARKRYPGNEYPHLEFHCLSALDLDELEGPFDTILLVNSITEIPDLAELFTRLKGLCHPETRVVQMSYNYLLAPVMKAASRTGAVPEHPVQNWLTRYDFENMMHLTGWRIIRSGFAAPMPFQIPWLSEFLNRYVPLIPGLRLLSTLYYTVMRPDTPRPAAPAPSVSVCVPCRNEEGNIEGLAARIPEMGGGTEIIFVDDKSEDATAAKITEACAAHPDRNIRIVNGPGRGKGAACRAGFDTARNDILMILDADMTVMPEDLPGFYDALVSGRGEFINGSRLVYPMEQDAMRLPNIIGNRLFALLFSFVLSQRIKDTLCGTKVIWRSAWPKILEAREYFGAVDRWGDYDWIFGAARHSLEIVELPVHYRERTAGETKMNQRLKNGWIMLRMCWIGFRKVKLL
jgi:2-polyprenyl-3-methyl-5-hydroxy-6-metoxy-1,4-benzoquinol methylase